MKHSRGRHESDNDIFSSSKKHNNLMSERNSSEPNLQGPSFNNKSNRKGQARGKAKGGMNDISDDEDDYIVGPDSNHSSIKKRPFNGNRGL